MLVDRLNIIALIPARGGSRGIPKKNIIEFCGKPLVSWSIQQALGSKCIKDSYISSDDKEILDLAKILDIKVIKRPKRFATDASPAEEALQHAIDYIQKSTKEKIDIVVFLQPTSPLRGSEDVDRAIEHFILQKADSLFSSVILEDFCVWEMKNNAYKSVTFDYKNRGRRQDRQPYYHENGSIYIFKPEILKKYKNRLGGKISMYIMENWQFYEIDKPEDIEICEYFMRKKILYQKQEIDKKNIRLIAYDFDGVFTDNKVVLSEDGVENVVVNRADGLAIGIIKKTGIPQIILTTERNKVVETRADKLGIPVIKGVEDKREALLTYCKENNISLDNVVFVGNDLNDFEVMKIVGYPVCPGDSSSEIKSISRIVLKTRGGEGVARELIKYLLKGS